MSEIVSVTDQFNAVDAKLNIIIDALGPIAAVGEKLETILANVEQMSNQLDSAATTINTVESAVSGVDGKVTRIEKETLVSLGTTLAATAANITTCIVEIKKVQAQVTASASMKSGANYSMRT